MERIPALVLGSIHWLRNEVIIMPKSNLLIRDYNNIRRILRDIYIFGCYSRDDFIDKGFSGRKYDNEQRRINAYLPHGFLKKRRVNKKVQYYCYYGPYVGEKGFLAANRLAETYSNKSFTMLDITSYFFVLEILNAHPGLTLTELLDKIPQFNDDILFTKDNLWGKLGELEEYGLIRAHRTSRNVNYYVIDDIWKGYSEEELVQIYVFLEFAGNVMPIQMPYIFLRRKLKMYLSSKGITNLPEGVFQFKHNHLFTILDNEILLELLRAIDICCSAKILRANFNETEEVVPVKIIHECTYGRQYLLCMEYGGENAASMIRLDRISTVKIGSKLPKEVLRKAIDKTSDEERCWSTSGLGGDIYKIVIEIRIDEGKEPFIIRRLQREGHGGQITKCEDGVYRYEIEIRDPLEMTPWVRSFGEYMKVVDDGGSGLIEHIKSEWRRAVSKYETL